MPNIHQTVYLLLRQFTFSLIGLVISYRKRSTSQSEDVSINNGCTWKLINYVRPVDTKESVDMISYVCFTSLIEVTEFLKNLAL